MPLKHRLRSLLDRLARATGLLARYEKAMKRGLTVLMYHRVLPLAECLSYPLASLVMPRRCFTAQVAWLRAHATVLPLAEAWETLRRGERVEKPLVALTFDDGYGDNHRIAAPILEEAGLRGTFYVTTRFVAEGNPLWYDRAAAAWGRLDPAGRDRLWQDLGARGPAPDVGPWMEALKGSGPRRREELVERAEKGAAHPIDPGSYRPMTAEQVADLARRGHEIGSHTVTHPILVQLADDALHRELADSADQLEAWTGRRPTGFCYPNGDHDRRVDAAILATGYSYGCTTAPGINLPHTPATGLARLSLTMARVLQGDRHDLLGFRAELCRLRNLWRRQP